LNVDTFRHILVSSPTKQPQYVVMVMVMDGSGDEVRPIFLVCKFGAYISYIR